MHNRDNLDDFIKNEINRIEFDDADAMWQDFESRLVEIEPVNKNGFWFWIRNVSIVLILIIVGLLSTSTFKTSESKDASHTDKISLKEKRSLSTSINTNSGHNDLSISGENVNVNKRTDTDSSSEIHMVGGAKSIDLNPVKVSEKSTSFLQSDNDGFSEKKGTVANSINAGKGMREEMNANGMMATIIHQPDEGTQLAQNPASTKPISEDGNRFLIDFSPIASIIPQKLKSTHSTQQLEGPSINVTAKKDNISNNFFSLENNFGQNGIHQFAFGIGKFIPLSTKWSIKMQAGGSLNRGFSFSQDSLFTLVGLSIEESRKDKDLKHIWSTYLDLGLYHNYGKWRIGGGLRGSYAVINKFQIVESLRISGLGTFNVSSGGVTGSTSKRESWTGINRLRFDAYFNLQYQIKNNFSLGLYLGKSFNEIIQENLAKQAYSNTPVMVGVQFTRHF